MAERKGSIIKGDNDNWTCKMCEKEYMDKKSEFMKCEYCDKNFCSKCLNLTNAEYKLFNKRSDLHWYCPPCEEKTMKNIKIEKEIEDRCKEFFSKYENRLEALESEVRKKVDMSTVKDMIDESIVGKLKEGNENIAQSSEDIKEFRESEARRNNIIVFKAKEPESLLAEDGKREDLEFVSEMCEIMKTNPKSVKSITRLGKINREKTVTAGPRPMKIVFDDAKSKAIFMSNLRNLSTAEAKYKGVSVVHDMTMKERQLNKEQIRMAKEKNDGNESGDFIYLVRGPPWDRKIVSVKVKK